MSEGMKTIYLCGAINGCTDAQCKDWRERVKKELDGKFNFLDPMRRDYRGREGDHVRDIVHGDYDDITASDIILAAADNPSWGTAMEIHQAYQYRKTVVTVCGAARISPWLKYHSHQLFPTLDDAIAYLLAYHGATSG
jgi:hypothetical protein